MTSDSLYPRRARSIHDQPFPSRRSAVMGLGPMVATSQPLAAQAGLSILAAGGNAFDAAVATAAMLAVVEPTGTGPGGDAFALVYRARGAEIHALNGSGRAPAALTPELLRAGGHTQMPQRGALSVTVPGAVDAWAALARTHGRMSLAELLAPAVAVADGGYPVSELIALAWQASEPLLAAHPDARQHFLPGGRAPRAGEIIRLPALARSLRLIAEGGAEAFYRGPIGAAIVDTVQAAGGCLDASDLADHYSTWDQPIHTAFRGIRVWECPPNGQGLAALQALAIVDGLELAPAAWAAPDTLHPCIEAMRLAFADARAWIGDPATAAIPVAALLSERSIAGRRALIRMDRALPDPVPGTPVGDDTVYLAVVDAEGNACSFINSNYMGFGSGLVAGTTGIALQNRGAGFVLDPQHPNACAPRKRPYHTIIPGLATRPDGSLYACFGVMGGHMQPQGHLQLMVNLRVHGMDPQRALDAPRWQVTPQGRIGLEPWFGNTVRQSLASRGHTLVPTDTPLSAASFGGGQLIAITREGVRVGGSDPRKDGCVVAS
jgi:gamma-glutamyltranspeptidase/glutathione hydrolase